MVIYEKIKDIEGKDSIKRTDEDGTIWFIPCDETNADYQAYLASLEEGEPKAE